MLEKDAALHRRYQEGDRAVLAMLYDAYLQPLAAFFARGCTVQLQTGPIWLAGVRSTFEIEELCHAVFERAFGAAARARYDGKRAFKTYLFAIGRNHRIDLYRRARFEVVRGGSSLSAAPDPAPPVDDTLSRRQLDGLLTRFVDDLGEPDASYYRLRYHQGLSQTAAATHLELGRTPGRAIERDLKRRLIAFLQRHGYGR